MRKFEIIMSLDRINRQIKQFIYSIDKNINPTAYRLLYVFNTKSYKYDLFYFIDPTIKAKLIKKNYVTKPRYYDSISLTEKGCSTLSSITKELEKYVDDILAEEKFSKEDLVKANKILCALTSKISTHDDDDERIKFIIMVINISNEYRSLISNLIHHRLTPIPEFSIEEYKEANLISGNTIFEVLTIINNYKLDTITTDSFNELNYDFPKTSIRKIFKLLQETNLIRRASKVRTRPMIYYVNKSYIDVFNKLNDEVEEIYNRTPFNLISQKDLEFANNFFYNLIRID